MEFVSWDDDIPNNPNVPNHHNKTCSEDMKNLKQVWGTYKTLYNYITFGIWGATGATPQQLPILVMDPAVDLKTARESHSQRTFFVF